jgi:anaerobic selenocysteine-containing dehydrogenase
LHADIFRNLPFCSGGCGALFTVNKNEIVAVQGDPAHPVSQGALCPKAGQGRRRGPAGRVTRPLWRPPGADEWREISWRQAIALLAARLKEARDAGWIPEDARTDGIAVFGSAAITTRRAICWPNSPACSGRRISSISPASDTPHGGRSVIDVRLRGDNKFVGRPGRGRHGADRRGQRG